MPQNDMLDMPNPKTLAAGTPTGQDASTTTQNDTNREAQNVRLRTRRRQTKKQAHTTQDALIAKGYTTVIAPDGTTHFLAPGAKHQTFALALNAAMKRLGMSSSDLARDIWGESVDKRGVKLGQIDYRVPGARVTKKRRVRVPISDRLMPVLQEAWLQAPKATGGQACGPVVTGILPRNMGRVFHRFTKVIGMEWVSPHVLRHSWASLAAMNGVSLWDIAQVMGDTITVIERTYLHLTPGHLRSAINHKAGRGYVPLSVGTP